jgi:hypothetical protein
MLILNAPAGYVENLAPLPVGAMVSQRPEGTYDFVQLFVKDSKEFDALQAQAVQAVRYDGLFWLSYPKKSSKVETDLSREMVWELMLPSGLRPVAQVAIDEVWSALRFRPAERVG